MAMPMLGYTARGLQQGAANVRQREMEDERRRQVEEAHKLRMESGRFGLDQARAQEARAADEFDYSRSTRESPEQIEERRSLDMEGRKYKFDRTRKDDALKDAMDALRQAQGRLVGSQGTSYKDFEEFYNKLWPNDELVTIDRHDDGSFTVTNEAGQGFKVPDWEHLGALAHAQLNPENYYKARAEAAKTLSERKFELEKMEKEYLHKEKLAIAKEEAKARGASDKNKGKVPDREKYYVNVFLKDLTGADDDSLAASTATDADRISAARHAAVASKMYQESGGEMSDSEVILRTRQYMSRLRAVLKTEGEQQGLESEDLSEFINKGMDERVARVGLGAPPVEGARYSRKYGKWMVRDPNGPGWLPHDEVPQRQPVTAGLSRTSADGSTVNDAGVVAPPAAPPTAGVAPAVGPPAEPKAPRTGGLESVESQTQEIESEVAGTKFYDIGYSRARELIEQLEALRTTDVATKQVRDRVTRLIERLKTIPESSEKPSVAGDIKSGLRGLTRSIIGE